MIRSQTCGGALDSAAIVRQFRLRRHDLPVEPETEIQQSRKPERDNPLGGLYAAIIAIIFLLLFEGGILVGWLSGGGMP